MGAESSFRRIGLPAVVLWRRMIPDKSDAFLRQKVLLLGAARGSPWEMTEAERKRMLSALDREVRILEEPLTLLSQTSARE